MFCFDILAITDRKDKEVTGESVVELLPTIERLFYTFVLHPLQWSFVRWLPPAEPPREMEQGPSNNQTIHHTAEVHRTEEDPEVQPVVHEVLGVSGRLVDFGWYLVVMELVFVAGVAGLGSIVLVLRRRL